MQFREITNLSYYVHIQVFKQRNVDQIPKKNMVTFFFLQEIRLNYKELHIDGVITESIVKIVKIFKL